MNIKVPERIPNIKTTIFTHAQITQPGVHPLIGGIGNTTTIAVLEFTGLVQC